MRDIRISLKCSSVREPCPDVAILVSASLPPLPFPFRPFLPIFRISRNSESENLFATSQICASAAIHSNRTGRSPGRTRGQGCNITPLQIITYVPPTAAHPPPPTMAAFYPTAYPDYCLQPFFPLVIPRPAFARLPFPVLTHSSPRPISRAIRQSLEPLIMSIPRSQAPPCPAPSPCPTSTVSSPQSRISTCLPAAMPTSLDLTTPKAHQTPGIQ